MARNSEFVRSGFGLMAAVLSVGIFAGSALAQEPAVRNVDRARLLQEQSPMQSDPYSEENGVDNGRAMESPNDPDLGEQEILKRIDRYEPFAVSLSAPFYYTSNVALVRSGEESDLLFAPGFGITYAPRFTRTLYGMFAIQQTFFYYDRFSDLDFGSSDFRAGLTYLLPKLHNLLLRAEYDYNRLTFSNSFDEFFSNHSLAFGAELPFRFGRAQQVSLGTDANISLHADPDGPQRNDFDLYAGYSARLTRALTLDAVARLFVRDYHESDRVDVSEVLAISANYRITKCLTAGAASTFAWSQSNQSVFDYDVVNIGGAFTLSFRF